MSVDKNTCLTYLGFMKDFQTFSIQKVLGLFGRDIPRNTVISAERLGLIPKARRKEAGSVRVREWGVDQIPYLGERYGFLKNPYKPVSITVFTTKGGVLKTTLALNIARMAALHNIRTCVVGLDIQGDITSALGFDVEPDDDDDLQDSLKKLNERKGLHDIFTGDLHLKDVIAPTDIPTLWTVPETPELAMTEQGIRDEVRREFWLKENIGDKLKKKFDLIVYDCGPNWNFLVTNAIVACDILVCPLECKINNFRNLTVFRAFTASFKKKLKLDFHQIFVPTKVSGTKKMAVSIRSWYMANIPGCTNSAIRESVAGEEAVAAHLSLSEYDPKSIASEEMRNLLMEIWSYFPKQKATRNQQPTGRG